MKWAAASYGLVELAAVAVVVIVHLLKDNALLSIANPPAAYMFMINPWWST